MVFGQGDTVYLNSLVIQYIWIAWCNWCNSSWNDQKHCSGPKVLDMKAEGRCSQKGLVYKMVFYNLNDTELQQEEADWMVQISI